jgi:L-rhamnose mutarotase
VGLTRQVFTIDVRDDPAAIAAYREHHRRVWPEVIESLRRAGVEQLDIHMLGRRLVMIVEVRDGTDYRQVFAAHVASSPRVAEWERLMKSLQEPVPHTPAGQWWALMEPVFSMNGNGAASPVAERSDSV